MAPGVLEHPWQKKPAFSNHNLSSFSCWNFFAETREIISAVSASHVIQLKFSDLSILTDSWLTGINFIFIFQFSYLGKGIGRFMVKWRQQSYRRRIPSWSMFWNVIFFTSLVEIVEVMQVLNAILNGVPLTRLMCVRKQGLCVCVGAYTGAVGVKASDWLNVNALIAGFITAAEVHDIRLLWPH